MRTAEHYAKGLRKKRGLLARPIQKSLEAVRSRSVAELKVSADASFNKRQLHETIVSKALRNRREE